MTKREIELKIEAWKYHIADKFKDIQVNANALKYAENQGKNNQLLMKITDAIDDIKRSYGEIATLEITTPDEEDSLC